MCLLSGDQVSLPLHAEKRTLLRSALRQERTQVRCPFVAAGRQHGHVALLRLAIRRKIAIQRKTSVLLPDASLGQRLAFRRWELGHGMVDAAAIAGVDPKTWMWWERDEREPYVHQYPAIIPYLGYEPWPEAGSLGEKLLAQRRRHGLSIKRAADIAGVDEGTFGRWESGKWSPQQRSLPLVGAFLGWVP